MTSPISCVLINTSIYSSLCVPTTQLFWLSFLLLLNRKRTYSGKSRGPHRHGCTAALPSSITATIGNQNLMSHLWKQLALVWDVTSVLGNVWTLWWFRLHVRQSWARQTEGGSRTSWMTPLRQKGLNEQFPGPLGFNSTCSQHLSANQRVQT